MGEKSTNMSVLCVYLFINILFLKHGSPLNNTILPLFLLQPSMRGGASLELLNSSLWMGAVFE